MDSRRRDQPSAHTQRTSSSTYPESGRPENEQVDRGGSVEYYAGANSFTLMHQDVIDVAGNYYNGPVPRHSASIPQNRHIRRSYFAQASNFSIVGGRFMTIGGNVYDNNPTGMSPFQTPQVPSTGSSTYQHSARMPNEYNSCPGENSLVSDILYLFTNYNRYYYPGYGESRIFGWPGSSAWVVSCIFCR